VPDVGHDTQLVLIASCSLCGDLLPISCFYADRRTAIGRRLDCKKCCVERDQRRKSDPDVHARYLEYQAAYRKAHREKARATSAAWRTANPEWHQTNQERWRAIPANRQSMRERARAFRLADPVRRAEYGRRRHALKLSCSAGVITSDQLMAKLAYWGFRCWMCGSADKLEIDHVKPLSRGGAHVLCNLRPACAPCNNKKRAKWPVDLSGYLAHRQGRRRSP
jgi:5-methylcytosine-specific restriction endonuclease McrA